MEPGLEKSNIKLVLDGIAPAHIRIDPGQIAIRRLNEGSA